MKTIAINNYTKLSYYSAVFIVLLLACTNVSLSQSGFPFAYGDQIIYYPKLQHKTQNIEAIKTGLTQSLKRVSQVYDIKTGKTYYAKNIKDVSVLNDKIEIEIKGKKNKLIWLFDEIDDSTFYFFGKENAGNYLFLPQVANLAFAELDAAQQFADNIYAIQYPVINKLRSTLLESFKTKAVAFKLSNELPLISDEQKKLFTAADSASSKMDFFNAIRIYNKALELNEMTYPQAYANTALLYAHINFFDYAILYMQQYLCLETDVAAIRGAKDKLYEWEGLIYY